MKTRSLRPWRHFDLCGLDLGFQFVPLGTHFFRVQIAVGHLVVKVCSLRLNFAVFCSYSQCRKSAASSFAHSGIVSHTLSGHRGQVDAVGGRAGEPRADATTVLEHQFLDLADLALSLSTVEGSSTLNELMYALM